MVTKPVPFYKRWLRTPGGREKALLWYYLSIILLNLFIAFGLLAFLYFWLAR